MSKRKLDHAAPAAAPGADSVEALRKAYKKAKREHRRDKSDKDLKRAKREAKKAWERAAAANATATAPTLREDADASINADERAVGDRESSRLDGKYPEKAEAVKGASEEGEGAEDGIASCSEQVDDNRAASEDDIHRLESAYRAALAAFKADKSNKDLRRAKTAARRALDDAIAARHGDGAEELTCRDCSKKFIFTPGEREYYTDKLGYDTTPTRCKGCGEARRARMAEKRAKMDGAGNDKKGRNMCYAFQRGECPHGDRCKFSHNPKHGGKRSGKGAGWEKGEGGVEEKGGKEGDGLDAKVRKERSLKRKGKGWRNK